MATLQFVRHGQASLFAADYDELSEHGRAQARALGEHLAAVGIVPDQVWTGPARRQRDTAAIAREAAHGYRGAAGATWPEPVALPELDEHDAFGMVAKIVPRLGEDPEIAPHQRALAGAKGFGARSAAFQRLFEAIMTRWLNGEIELHADDGVETWPVFRDRVERGLRHLVSEARSGARVFAFSSVGPLAVLLRHALEAPDLFAFKTAWRCRNASVTRFAFSPPMGALGRFTLDAFNDLAHLPDPSTHTFR